MENYKLIINGSLDSFMTYEIYYDNVILSLAYFYLKADGSVYIQRLETIKSHTRKGYGSLLMEKIINNFGGKYDIKLQCTPFNYIGVTFETRKEQLKNFYEKFGFEVYEAHPKAYFMIRHKKG